MRCTPSHYGTASCAGSGVRLDPRAGLLNPTAYVQTGNQGLDTDYYASDTTSGIATVPLRMSTTARQVHVVVDYRLATSPVVTTSAGNSGSNTLIVAATPRGCRDCADTTQTTLTAGVPAGTVGTVVLAISNPYGDVPAGWIDITIKVQSFATIGFCNGPCGEPGVGDAKASVGVNVRQVRLQ